MRLVAFAALAIAAVLVTAPQLAEACSCYNPLRVMPGNGDAEVPTNVVIVVRNLPLEMDASALSLEGPDGTVAVETEVVIDEPSYRVHLIEPRVALAPNTEYVLRGLSDDVRFTTGAAPDGVAPEPVELGELVLARADDAEGNSSCGNEYSFVDLAITPPDDATAIELAVGRGIQTTRYLVDSENFGRSLSNWDATCGIHIPLEAGAHTCFSVRARDAAGNLSASVERCATVTACAYIEDSDDFDGDLTDCEPAPPRGSGCNTTSSTGLVLPLLAMFLLATGRRRRPR